MKSNITKLSIITIISLFTLAVIGLSYAYFSTEITGEGKYVTLDTATLKLKYTDNTVLSLDNAIPGDSVTKTFTVENIGTKKVSYNIVWNNLINTINNYDLHLDMKCKSYKNYNTTNQVEEGKCDSFYKAVPYTETSISKDIKRNNEIDIGITHEYTITITFKNRSYNQKDNLNKQFSGKIDLEEYVDPSPEPIYCNLPEGTTLEKGTIYESENSQYIYSYLQESTFGEDSLVWVDMPAGSSGWGVRVKTLNNTEPLTDSVCTYINNEPVTSMAFMYAGNQTETLDLSKLNTSNVTNMSGVFYANIASSLDLSSFDTSKVTNMFGMFGGMSNLTNLDLSNFDTTNVITMNAMFGGMSNLISLDLSNFDTSNVVNMSSMFSGLKKLETLNISSFNTSKSIDMSSMFNGIKILTLLDLSNFNTSNVTDMSSMFSGMARLEKLDISSFDTRNVTDMNNMFSTLLAITTLNLNNFNTSNVTNMRQMFYSCFELETLYIDNFNTNNVTNMQEMFRDDYKLSLLNIGNFSTDKLTNMSLMFYNCNSLLSLDLGNFDTSKVTNASDMFYHCTDLRVIFVGNKFITDGFSSDVNIFDTCTNLVGGAGTKFDPTKTRKEYARIDGGKDSPGYFTAK